MTHIQPDTFWRAGQMTMELVYALPVFILLAFLVAQCVHVLNTCIAFDGYAHELARIEVVAPSSGVSSSEQARAIEQKLSKRFDSESVEVSTRIEELPLHHARAISSITIYPQFFGRSMPRDIFGMRLPSFTHSAQTVFTTYAKAGIA